jgi:hypothetical protein
MPESKMILDMVGEFMTREELVAVRGGIEALGRVLHCGDEKEVCMPLLRVQKHIELNLKNEQGKH